MRKRVYRHMLQTRGWKYRAFLRYLRIFKYIAFAPARGAFLENYYTLMRYLDDIVDGDLPLPDGYNSAVDYIKDKIQFSRDPVAPRDEADYLLLYCYELGNRFSQEFHAETADILESLLFDAGRRGTKNIFPVKELGAHFHKLDIRGTIRATLKIFREDPAKYLLLEPLGMASRFQFDLEDIDTDLQAGYVNISEEDCIRFCIGPSELKDPLHPHIRNWMAHHAREGMALLDRHHQLLKGSGFSLLARATFSLVYEGPARKVFLQTIRQPVMDPHKSPVYAPGTLS